MLIRREQNGTEWGHGIRGVGIDLKKKNGEKNSGTVFGEIRYLGGHWPGPVFECKKRHFVSVEKHYFDNIFLI